MGPTNIALVKLFQADAALRQANERYESAARSVRIQERRLNDLGEKLKLAQQKFRELQARAGAFDLDTRSRNEHIEKLRTQQQNAKNNKEYQAFLTEINTGKIDKSKVEEEAFKVMEQVEKTAAEVKDLSAQADEARKTHAATKEQLGGRLSELQKEIDELKPIRQAAAAAVPPRALIEFERLTERNDGEAMAPIAKPDRRREEYVCTSCNIALVVDVYNRLHSRDEIIKCPNCQCLLYIPDDLPPEMAVHKGGAKPAAAKVAAAGEKKKRSPAARPKAAKASAATTEGGAAPVRKPSGPKSPWADLLRRAHGESVKNAIDASAPPVECEVFIDDQSQGTHKGKSAENLEQVIRFHLKEAGRTGTVRVVEKTVEKLAPVAAAEAAPLAAAQPPATESPAPANASPAGPTAEVSTAAPVAPSRPLPPAAPPISAAPPETVSASPAQNDEADSAPAATDGVPEDVSSNA